MKSWVDDHFPLMQSRLYEAQSLEGDDGHPPAEVEAWTMEEAEARLQAAYEQGGLQSWASQAVVELNRELQWRRTTRRT
jgi:hypothetical protein